LPITLSAKISAHCSNCLLVVYDYGAFFISFSYHFKEAISRERGQFFKAKFI
jgi:hypothetical protein